MFPKKIIQITKYQLKTMKGNVTKNKDKSNDILLFGHIGEQSRIAMVMIFKIFEKFSFILPKVSKFSNQTNQQTDSI